ncbi:small outer capsid protein [Enterobacter phage vB_Ent31]|uniref:Small outer capsid protein n=1 Tax=Enterobacter phage CC31 TaxID=709484 RepID=E5DI36_9CAUD|nr:virion structural protein [Enterobacter phage CC31]ADB81521.1 small outer capsid protein [Enterobacter phage CC31]URQ04102.1 capsid and scaffold [Enterobacter phage vB_EclM-UFV01]WOF01155.1 small outer capsid protein [Enterobacter phage vB_Ent31]
MPYVNIKTKARTFKGTSIPAKEVSVDFKLYSDVHKIAGTMYIISTTETALFSTKFEYNQRDAWVAFNEELVNGPAPSDD